MPAAGGRTFNMDQIKFVSNGRNSQTDSNPKVLKSSSTQNVFKSNALKNLSKNMNVAPILQEKASAEESFGDYKDPFDKEARDFINSQLDVRLSVKSKDEMTRNQNNGLNIIRDSSVVNRLSETLVACYPLVNAKYEQGSTVKKQQIVQ